MKAERNRKLTESPSATPSLQEPESEENLWSFLRLWTCLLPENELKNKIRMEDSRARTAKGLIEKW